MLFTWCGLAVWLRCFGVGHPTWLCSVNCLRGFVLFVTVMVWYVGCGCCLLFVLLGVAIRGVGCLFTGVLRAGLVWYCLDVVGCVYADYRLACCNL